MARLEQINSAPADHLKQGAVPHAAQTFAAAADNEAAPGLIADFWDFLKHNKKWWLTPILLAILLIGGLVLLSSSALAPFIYPLF